MTEITLRIEKADHLQKLMELIQQLDLTVIQTPVKSVSGRKKATEKAREYILSYQNAQPSFGDAVAWQRSERTERELPFQQ